MQINSENLQNQQIAEKVPQWIVETRREGATLAELGFAATTRNSFEEKLKKKSGQIIWSSADVVVCTNRQNSQAVKQSKSFAAKNADAVKSVRFVYLPDLKETEDLTDFAARRNGSTPSDLMALLDGAEYFDATSKQKDNELNSAFLIKEADQWLEDAKTRPVSRRLFGDLRFEDEIAFSFLIRI